MHNEQENHPTLPEQNDGLNHIDADSGAVTPDAPKDKPSGKVSKWRWLRGGLLALIALLVLLIGGVLIAAQSERGTRALWQATKVLSGGHVQSQWLSGSLAHGGSAQSLQIHFGTVHIDIFELSGDWRWSVLPVHWQVDRLAAQRLDITLLPSEKKSQPLEQITMPLAFTVDHLSVPQVNLIQGLQTTELKDVSGSVSTDKVQHHINLTHLRQGGAPGPGADYPQFRAPLRPQLRIIAAHAVTPARRRRSASRACSASTSAAARRASVIIGDTSCRLSRWISYSRSVMLNMRAAARSSSVKAM